MKAELRYLHSPDVFDLKAYEPPDPSNFCILVQAMVGPLGGNVEESFDFLVCTPNWLQNELAKNDYVFGRHYLFLPEYEYELLHKALVTLCNRFSEHNWQAIAEKLGRYGRWEFEDYKP